MNVERGGGERERERERERDLNLFMKFVVLGDQLDDQLRYIVEIKDWWIRVQTDCMKLITFL